MSDLRLGGPHGSKKNQIQYFLFLFLSDSSSTLRREVSKYPDYVGRGAEGEGGESRWSEEESDIVHFIFI